MFEQIHHQLMGWFTTRRTLEDKTLGLLVAKSAEHLQSVTNNRARRYRSVPSILGVLYEVKSMETRRNYVVDLAQHSCTCSIWQSSGHPCGHAISIILDQKQDPQRYVESIFTIAAYKNTYEQPIIPLDLANVNGDAIHSRPPLFQMKRILNPKMTPFYPLLLIVLLEGLQNTESVVGMMKLIAQSVSSYVRGVGRAVSTRVRRVISQLMQQHDCFQVLGIHLT